jgi:hypothetical protein
VLALDPLLQREHHVVAQVIEAELVVGAVGDVGEVGRSALRRGRLRIIQTGDGYTQVVEDVSHPLGVTPGQVVIDRDEVGAATGERVEVERQGGDEGLAFAGRHFGDPALVQHDAADELHVVRDHVPAELVPGHHHLGAQQTTAGFAHRGVRFREELVEHRSELLLPLQLQLVEALFQPFPARSDRGSRASRPAPLELGFDSPGFLRDPVLEPLSLRLELGFVE